MPRHHLVQNGSEAEDVAPVIDGFSAQLLRRHVGNRPNDSAVLGDRRETVDGLTFCRGLKLGYSKVEDFDPAIMSDKQVFRLQIAVDDVPVVCGGPREVQGKLMFVADKLEKVTRP